MSVRTGLVMGFIGLSFAAGSAAAVEVYKWVAEDGSTHYSESSPEGEIAGFEVLQLSAESQPVTPPSHQGYQSTLDVAASLQASRLEREKLRLEKEKIRQQARRDRLNEQRYYDAYMAPSYYLPYYRYPYRPYAHKHRYGKHPGRPRHPRPSRPATSRVYLNK